MKRERAAGLMPGDLAMYRFWTYRGDWIQTGWRKGKGKDRHVVHGRIYTRESADKHGVKYLHWKDENIKPGMYALFDDGFVADVIDVHRFNGANRSMTHRLYKLFAGNGERRIIKTSAGSAYTGFDVHNLHPFQPGPHIIGGFKARINIDTRKLPVKLEFYRKYFEEGKSLERVFREMTAYKQYEPGGPAMHDAYIAFLDEMIEGEKMKDIIDEKLKTELQMQIERSISNVSNQVNTAFESLGINAEKIAKRLEQLMYSENERVALAALQEINKLLDTYPKKLKVTESGQGMHLQVTTSERNAIEKALGEVTDAS